MQLDGDLWMWILIEGLGCDFLGFLWLVAVQCKRRSTTLQHRVGRFDPSLRFQFGDRRKFVFQCLNKKIVCLFSPAM